jgi:hypothetical protein
MRRVALYVEYRSKALRIAAGVLCAEVFEIEVLWAGTPKTLMSGEAELLCNQLAARGHFASSVMMPTLSY